MPDNVHNKQKAFNFYELLSKTHLDSKNKKIGPWSRKCKSFNEFVMGM